MTINHQPCYKTPTKKKQKTFRNPETCGRDTSSSITVYTCTCTCMFGSATSYLAGALGLCAVPHSTSIAALVPHILMIFLFFWYFFPSAVQWSRFATVVARGMGGPSAAAAAAIPLGNAAAVASARPGTTFLAGHVQKRR